MVSYAPLVTYISEKRTYSIIVYNQFCWTFSISIFPPPRDGNTGLVLYVNVWIARVCMRVLNVCFFWCDLFVVISTSIKFRYFVFVFCFHFFSMFFSVLPTGSLFCCEFCWIYLILPHNIALPSIEIFIALAYNWYAPLDRRMVATMLCISELLCCCLCGELSFNSSC